MRKDERDRVIFRKWSDGDVIAILPDQDANPGRVMCFMHVGEHGEGDYWHLLNVTRPAKPDEYADLLEELSGRGYKLRVVKRLQHEGR